MENTLRLNDNLNARDTLAMEFNPSVLSRTRVMGGYDAFQDEKGVTQLGEVLFDQSNQIVIGGALYVLEKIFGVASPLTVDYLNNIMNIANTGTPITEIYPKENVICLFGVGIGGCGDASTAVKPVKFYERELVDMIPFRATDQPLSAADLDKYWFKKALTGGKTGYYLKKFEAAPVIKALWKDGVGDADGTEVENGVHTTTRTEPIETFVELILKISKTDVREWFAMNGNVEQTRVNTIGLFTGVKGQLQDNSWDYKQVKMFSKLNINNEMLTLAKDLTIIYRIYTS